MLPTNELEIGAAASQDGRLIYSVTQLTREIKLVLESAFTGIWVEGEISNFIFHSSGHMYFDLKDEGAVLHCAFFRNANCKIKFEIKEGLKAVCFGRISAYEKRGQYQFYVDRMEPKGVGELQLAFEQLKERLQKEGLFDPAHKVPIPFLPSKIGVATSPTGAVIRDILHILRRRFNDVEVLIYPVKVQGDGAAQEIAQAIADFNSVGGIDVLIVARGGGSLEDLWAFNEEIVARAIYNSDIPVISAVGHEVDYTIADFVADLRAPTPSAAAELVIARKEDLAATVINLTKSLNICLRRAVERYEQELDDLIRTKQRCLTHIIEMALQRLDALVGKIEALSPLSVLRRGYSITFSVPKRTVLKGVKGVKPGDTIETRLAAGRLISQVKEILKEEVK